MQKTLTISRAKLHVRCRVADDLIVFAVDDDILVRLHRSFKGMDADRSGKLTLDEFKALPQLKNNPLVSHVFRAFDLDGNGEVDFEEFVKWLDTFIVNSDDGLSRKRFMFSIYDMDGDGVISNGDLFSSLKIMIGSNLSDLQLQQLVHRTILQGDQDRDGKLSFEEWCQMVEHTGFDKSLSVKL